MEYGLIGEKLGHSYSKEIHESLGRYSYELKPLAPDELESFIVSREYKGLNVTIPYKEKVIPLLDEVDPKALEIGAVNTIVNKDGRLVGYNTDYYGMRALILDMNIATEGAKALILGTGGTSKTAKAVLESLGVREIVKAGRKGGMDAITYEEAYRDHADADIIVNTTPVGMHPSTDNKPIDLGRFLDLKGVVDVIYNPSRTELVLEALGKGIPAVTGLYMLVMQALEAAKLFTGEPVEERKAREITRSIASAKMNLVLTGMPGSGKSTIGIKVAERLGLKFTDTDALIVEREGVSIPDIFKEKGEGYFRDLESEVIAELSLQSGLCISTGGGAVLKDINVKRLSHNGRIVFIDRDPAELIPTSDRPLADDINKIAELYNKRYSIYCESADRQVKNVGIEETTEAVCGFWQNM
ncbi:MAG: shikimate dehydrogenase [Lachnospiraceae bacterium]|nr:shikimate dehydrogenase [Lachnospiraceae bacterium]